MVPATGVRIGWADLPVHVREAVETILGSRVTAAQSQAGGFSPGTADRVETAAGGRAFVKAVGIELNATSVEMARAEAHITAHLPAAAPAPRMLGSFDDGRWVALVLEDIEGRHPHTPWQRDELDTIAAALRRLAETLTPSPLPDLPRAADTTGGDFAGWANIAANPPDDLAVWAADNLDELQEAAVRGHAALATGNTLAHCDIRADNILVRPQGSVVFVDWPWGCIGPAWLDTLLLALNVIVHGGSAGHLLRGMDARLVTDVIAGYTGFLLDLGRLPAPPGLPTVRAFQRAQGNALLPWLRARMTG